MSSLRVVILVDEQETSIEQLTEVGRGEALGQARQLVADLEDGE